ncbi:cytochrome P450 [Amycolatopsis nigrescens]|uniref:cytochrome P450 n=1 Tax=Amycolatopsis nigrescens TaxID=381445 RepID=UPI000376433F|nr:cytochrome P450 [Amycolatopsis nigrescens]
MVLDVLDVEDIDFAGFTASDIPDLHGTLAELRARKPYAVVPFAGTRAILLLTHDLVTAAFKDEATFPASAIYPLTTGPVLGHTIQCMAGREHRVNRALVTPAFRRKLVASYAGTLLEPLAHDLVDRFHRRDEVDLVAEFTERYPVLVITRMLGLPAGDEEVLHRWARDLFHYPMRPADAKRASAEFTAYLTPVIEARRREPGDDLISTLAGTEVEGERLSDEQILSFLRLLFPAGADTSTLALGNVLAALLTHPDELLRVREDPDTELSWAVEESLRWEPPVALLPRVCPAAADWHGIAIPAGTPMIFGITAANRDPGVYPDPDRFDIGRRAMATLAFGDGPHTCLGTWLALAEVRAGLKVLLHRLPEIRLVAGADARIGGRLGAALRGPAALRVRLRR